MTSLLATIGVVCIVIACERRVNASCGAGMERGHRVVVLCWRFTHPYPQRGCDCAFDRPKHSARVSVGVLGAFILTLDILRGR
jgi:hypothetical protein